MESASDFKTAIGKLGYEVNDGLSFDYTNTLNGEPFKARSVDVVCSECRYGAHSTKCCKYHSDAHRALQAIRSDCDVVVNGRVWEV